MINYFPFLKACQYLLNRLENEFNKESNIDFILISDSLLLIEKYSELLNRNFTWCLTRYFIAFQSSYGECLAKDNIDESLFVFSNSSIALPLNYKKEQKNLTYINAEIQKYKILYDIKKEVHSDKENIEKIKNDFLNADKKNIEILSIFAAIVLFVAGDIQLFSKVTTITEALRFMLVFSYAIGLFVILIWLVTRANKFEVKLIPYTHKVIIWIWSIAAIIAFLICLPLWDKLIIQKPSSLVTVIAKRDSLNKLIDSLSKAPLKVKPDSIKKQPQNK